MLIAAHRPSPPSARRTTSRLDLCPQKGLLNAKVHLELRRVRGGLDLAVASSDQVTERIEIRLWLVGRR